MAAKTIRDGLLHCLVGIAFNGKVINKIIYLAVGLNTKGKKELLGLQLAEIESATFWINVLTDRKPQGVEDMLITCSYNLTGFAQSIKSVFSQAATQIGVLHLIKNSSRYVVWKDKKSLYY